MVEHHDSLFWHTLVVKCLGQTGLIMTIIVNSHTRIKQLFAKLTVHKAALILYSGCREAHKDEILQHIGNGIRIEHYLVLTQRDIDGMAAALGKPHGLAR